jgi:hypothetical protein
LNRQSPLNYYGVVHQQDPTRACWTPTFKTICCSQDNIRLTIYQLGILVVSPGPPQEIPTLESLLCFTGPHRDARGQPLNSCGVAQDHTRTCQTTSWESFYSDSQGGMRHTSMALYFYRASRKSLHKPGTNFRNMLNSDKL